MRTHQLEERKREECIHELGNVAHHRGLTDWRGGRGRSGLVSSETWQVTNEDSPTGGEEEGGGGWGAVKHGRWQMRTHEPVGRKREEGRVGRANGRRRAEGSARGVAWRGGGGGGRW